MPSYGYIINPKSGINGLKKQLCEKLDLTNEQQHKFTRCYLDSFDWRLLGKGLYLEADQHDNTIQLHLFRIKDQQLISQASTMQLPRFVSDLQQSRLAALIAPIIEVRALLPQIEIQVSQYRIAQRNKQNKITAELSIENVTHASTQRSPLKLLIHRPIKGYTKENDSITHVLSQESRLQPMQKPPLLWLIERLNIDTSYSNKPDNKLDPDARTDSQVKQLLAFFLTVMRRNETGIIEDTDTEFLHDFRIAMRRSRTLVGQVPKIMPQRTYERFSNQLAQLSTVTTPLRDLDVMLLNFDEYRGLLPDSMCADLDPAYEFVETKRQLSYRQVSQHLKSKTYTGFFQRWQTFLQSPVPSNTSLLNAKRPLKHVTDQRIWKAFKKVLKQGTAITGESAAADLHTLRKSCKKLRYLLEFFQPLYPANKIKLLIKTLKQLQDNLGEYQDIHIHIAFFLELRNNMQQMRQLPVATERALGKLVDVLNIQQTECRKQFHHCFTQFGSEAHQQLFQQLFRS